MSLQDDLENLEISKETRRMINNRLTDFEALGALLQSRVSAPKILEVLKVELEGRARTSYLVRIYGRYRKVLPLTDMEIINNWGRRHG